MFHFHKFDFHDHLCIISEKGRISSIVRPHTGRFKKSPVPVIDIQHQQDQNKSKRKNVLNICLKIYLIYSLWILTLSLGKFSRILKFNDYATLEINPAWEFFIPFFREDCTDLKSYTMDLILSLMLVIPFMVFFHGVIILFPVLAICIENPTIDLYNEMEFYSDLEFEKFDELDKLEEHEMKKTDVNHAVLRDIVRQRNLHVEECVKKVHKWIRLHQRLVKYAKQYQKCAKNVLELKMVTSWMSLIWFGFFFSNMRDNFNNYLFTISNLLVNTLISLLVHCNLGDMLENMSEKISEAVYSTPWYYFPIKEQKTILTFLCLSQRTHGLRLFGTYRLNLEWIPEILNQSYNYMQFLHLLVSKRAK